MWERVIADTAAALRLHTGRGSNCPVASVAAAVGVSEQYLRDVRGERKPISRDVLLRLIAVLPPAFGAHALRACGVVQIVKAEGEAPTLLDLTDTAARLSALLTGALSDDRTPGRFDHLETAEAVAELRRAHAKICAFLADHDQPKGD